MATIRFQPMPNAMGGSFTDIPTFPGAQFGIGYPEAIGDAARACWPNVLTAQCEQLDAGAWRCTGRKEGEVRYTMTITPAEHVVDIHFKVTNESDRPWEQSLAFNCFSCGAPEIRDHECLRHWIRTAGQFKRLIEIPRIFGPRPTIQLYNVEGAPPGKDIPFVAGFRTTPDIVLEGWLAIQSSDAKRLVATVSKPALFLFQNMEYSCIHSATSFGPLKPGETRKGINKIYFVEQSLEDWHKQMKADLA
jgi:hypothetical protein